MAHDWAAASGGGEHRPATAQSPAASSLALPMVPHTSPTTPAACHPCSLPPPSVRLEGAALAQSYGLSLIATALKRGQFFLVAEILRFLIPPRESSSGLVQWGPAGPPTPLAAAAAEAPGAATTQQQQQRLQKQPSADKTAAAAAGSSSGGWFGWLWGSGGSSSSSGSNAGQAQQRQHAQGSGPGGSPKASAGSLSAASQYRQSLAGGLAHANGDWHGLSGSGSAAGGGAAAADGGGGFAPGADACRVVAEKGWSLLGQVRRGLTGQRGAYLVCHAQQSAGAFTNQQL
jgi:hypothetical protein